MSNKRFQAGFFVLLVFFSASSCRYQVGYPLQNSGKSIFLHVENRSTAAQFGPVLNRMLKEELAQVGIYQITRSSEQAQLVVKVIIEDYHRDAKAYHSDDTLLASGFELRLQARVAVRKRKQKVELGAFTLQSQGYVMRSSALEQPKDRQALNDIARSLGSRIVSRLANQTW